MSVGGKRVNITLENLPEEAIEENSVVAVTEVFTFVTNFEIFVPTGTVLFNMSNYTRTIHKHTESVFESKLIIPLYLIIFVLAVLGNTLVLVTLMRNKRMRTVTNVYLLNLAISDLLLGVFCMPFTLVGQVLRNFIFGSTMCKLIPYFQAVSVSVGVWTLVAISLERYFAICRPLKSRRWQTQFHAYKMIACVWLASLFWSGPVLIVSSLKAMKRGHKCREDWPNQRSEQIFNLFLDVMLLLIPMLIMSLAYSLIMSKLWKGLQREIQHNTSCQQQMLHRSCSSANIQEAVVVNNKSSSPSSENGVASLRQHRLTPPCSAKIMTTVTKNNKRHKKAGDKAETVKMWLMKGFVKVKVPHAASHEIQGYGCTRTSYVPSCKLSVPPPDAVSDKTVCTENGITEQKVDETTYTFSRHGIRSNYMDKSIEAKKRVIRMLFVIVAEFFICWAPLHILNTWYLFYPEDVYKYVGSTGVSLVHLLAYVSSCCNPITYCFMNRKFRQAFLTAFNCRVCCCLACDDTMNGTTKFHNNGILKMAQNNSDLSANESTVYLGRASTIGRSGENSTQTHYKYRLEPRPAICIDSDFG